MTVDVRPSAESLPLEPVAREPLGDGRVERVDPAGDGAYARARCVLRGAAPETRYELRLLVHPFDPTCSNAPLATAPTPLRTDDAGDAAADAVFRDEDVPAAFRGADHGIRWEVVRDGAPVYASGCAAVRLS